MPLHVFKSGAQVDTGGNAISGNPVAPTTFVKSLKMGPLTASNYETGQPSFIFEADRPCQVIAIRERHTVVGSTTIMLVKAVGSTPLNSAIALLASTIPLTSTVDVENIGTLIASAAQNQLAAGNALGIRYTNSGNNPATGIVEVTLQLI